MIISHKLKLIFIHIPKNAGNYIKNLLNSYDNRCVNISGTVWGHQKILDIEKLISEHPDYTVFAVIRNPYSRAVSFYNFIKQTGHWLRRTVINMNFEEFLKFLANPPIIYKRNPVDFIFNESGKLVHTTQFDFICNKTGQIPVHTIRYENMEDDLIDFFGKLGVSTEIITNSIGKKVNNSKSVNYKSFYNDKTLELVKEIYSKDFEPLGYSADIEL